MLKDILIKTNRYARLLDEAGVPMDKQQWYSLIVKELKAFLACTLYINMKKIPNKKVYGPNLKTFFYCHLIVGLFTKEWYMALIPYLHIINSSTYAENRDFLLYDKMHQT